ncbi:DUF4174 domain-containing protein [Rhodovulum adriaticum]|uniref:Uncharacterized protein DUF4174 n=1 Tax=Rhodovulum adriaticum TaxID=35804 RepID=A0A4R2NK62_RHOAD|nr:DUF4174 domain-containing protein [Rhodovulum adriaticum]MBK1634648.1 hypothetical protein [Rhodovulum adriaticum]TCP21645.1 uncharacterized protein DUF4174 [Rhodovulum adriaticum]
MNTRLVSLALAVLTAFAPAAHAVEDATPLARWQQDPTAVLQAEGIAIEDFHWLARPVVVFADSPADPRYREQMELLLDRMDELTARDVVVIVDTDPSARSALRTKLRPRGFMLVLIGKDGGVKLRKPFPWDVRELSRSIDKMPLRQQEIRDGQ